MTRIVLLADRPDLIPALAAAMRRAWPEWYGPGGQADADSEARMRARRDALPVGLAALDEAGRVVGTAALAERSIASHAHLAPWLVGLWVHPDLRGRGLGQPLVAAVRGEAARLGVEWLHAATASAESLFLRDGWVRFDSLRLQAHPGEVIAVLRRRPGAPGGEG